MVFRIAFVFVLCFDVVVVLDNGLARTPPMGWMSWGYYMCADDCDKNPEKCLDEKLIISVADAFYNDGYLEAGYEYIVIDDCWSEKERDENGRLVPDKRRFPNGMKYLADYVHARGLKFGLYTNIAETTCMRYPGSRGHLAADAETFAEWGVDYLKVDGCFVEEEYLDTAYIELGRYLNETGRPIVYSCSWPYYSQFIHKVEPKHEAVAKHCNLWRNFHDVFPTWKSVRNILSFYTHNNAQMREYHRPGQWNDPDMLLVGTNALTEGQSRIQLSLFAMWSAPMLMSCDMAKIKPFEKKLLQNLDLIAISQDKLGLMATPYSLQPSLVLWVKRRLPAMGNKYHSFSFALVNFANETASASFAPTDFGVVSYDDYSVMDVFTGVVLKNITRYDYVPVSVPSEDVVLYTLFPL